MTGPVLMAICSDDHPVPRYAGQTWRKPKKCKEERKLAFALAVSGARFRKRKLQKS